MTVISHKNQALKKPISLRIVFILNAIKILLTLAFYISFTYGDTGIDLDPNKILYTGAAYVFFFGIIVFSIIKRNQLLLRISIILDFIASIPLFAFIGLIISAVSFLLTFRKSAINYLTA